MSSLGIRAATVLDADRFAATDRSRDDRADKEGLRRHWAEVLADPGAATYWVATWDGEIVAYAGATALGPGHERLLELSAMDILAEYEGRGIEGKLINHAIGEAPCLVWVDQDAHEKIGLYEDHGFGRDGAIESGRVRMVR